MKTRDLFREIQKHLPKKEYAVIAGARQVGKTTLMKQLFDTLNRTTSDAFFITLEDPDALRLVNTHPDRVFDYTGKIPGGGKRMFLFVDEIQHADDPSRFLKYLFDTYGNKLKVVAGGSSAFYIDKKFRDSLAGRKRLFEMYTLSFGEYLEFSGNPELRREWEKAREKKKLLAKGSRVIQSLFDQYLIYGGYPAVCLENDPDEKKRMLSELVNTYVKRDVMESGIAEQSKFFDLLRILASQSGNLLNVHELGNTLRLAHGTVENYLHIIRKCFHVHAVPPFYRNLRKELSKMPKVYFHDLGLRNSLLNIFSPPADRIDRGQLMETYAFIRLRELYGQDALKHWRTIGKNEVDFVVSSSFHDARAYEIKFNESEIREQKYRIFRENYPAIPFQFVAYHAGKNALPLLLL